MDLSTIVHVLGLVAIGAGVWFLRGKGRRPRNNRRRFEDDGERFKANLLKDADTVARLYKMQ